MNIRNWFGCEVQYDPNTAFNKSLDGLLELYATAVTRYFGLSPAANVDDVISKARDIKLPTGKELFLDWFLKKGLFQIRAIAKFTVAFNEDLPAEINYESYILKEELEEPIYIDDIRASLINIANDVLTLIESKDFVSMNYVFINPDEWSRPGSYLVLDTNAMTRELAEMQVSFLFY